MLYLKSDDIAFKACAWFLAGPGTNSALTFALSIAHTELSHDLVSVVLVACPFLFSIPQVCCWAAIGVCIQQLPAVDLQLSWLDVGMCSPDALCSTHRSGGLANEETVCFQQSWLK